MTKVVQEATICGVDLMRLKPVKYEWLVSGLLRVGRMRPSILVAKPTSGKSTLSRQLVCDVLRGQPFLGRPTVRSGALLWQVEEDLDDIQDSFNKLGYDPATDAHLEIFRAVPEQNNPKCLGDVLRKHQDLRLVIVEGMDRFLKGEKINGNTEMRKAFENLDKFIMEEFSSRVAVLLLHQLGKNERDDGGDEILGATEIRARTDTHIFLRPLNDDKDRRVVNAFVRKGVSLPESILEFDPATERSILGQTLAEYRRDKTDNSDASIKKAIIDWFSKHPNTSFEHDCLRSIRGNTDSKRKNWKEVLQAGDVVLSGGTGKSGSPRVYRIKHDAITEERAA